MCAQPPSERVSVPPEAVSGSLESTLSLPGHPVNARVRRCESCQKRSFVIKQRGSLLVPDDSSRVGRRLEFGLRGTVLGILANSDESE